MAAVPARSPSAAHPLEGKTVVLGVTGGIASYKAAELARLLVKEGAQVRAIMTERATAFLGELTLQTLTGHRVFTNPFELTQESEIGHIQLADAADLIVVAPATANAIARMAAGMADDALTSVVLASRAPLLLAPTMNVNMWESPLTQGNLRRLVEVAGARTVGPGAGFLACRWIGPGRMAEPADIAEAAARVLSPQDLEGRAIVVTAGPTHEPVDPVRFLGNRSSGKMGYAIAAAAARRGARVHLVSGPVELEPPPGIEVERVSTAREMERATRAAAERADAVIMAAAVADFRPAKASEQKIKKRPGAAAPALELASNPDILASLGAARAEAKARRPLLVGFAAETERLVEHARHKLEAKGCDLVVANDVSAADAGFGVDTNRVVLVDEHGEHALELDTKARIAHAIVDRVASLLGGS
jgi:phosphopantothenoylcysteine decarboxylase / phosphopantothenate---cysteine ligase